MALLSDRELDRARAISCLSYCNPFLPERIDYEREILADKFVDTDETWHKSVSDEVDRANIELLTQCTGDLANMMREKLADGQSPTDEEGSLYEDVVLYYLYNKYEPQLKSYIIISCSKDKPAKSKIDFYEEFQDDTVHYFALRGLTFSLDEADHLFALFFQLRRAFYSIFNNIIGGSMVSARLRAAVWESIFTSDMHRYRRSVYKRMGEITTLITGPSGTGKELVAQAIGMSRYIPFDTKNEQPAEDFTESFCPLNLSALSPTLIESELFGHAKGSFTGAIKDRTGYFETCQEHGTVFLDEIGDLDTSIQVKLLRVLQTGKFQRIGDTATLNFRGKIVAATNRDLAREMEEGRFREDLYYRLCSDIVVTPSLRDQIEGAPEQLQNLLLFITKRVAGDEEADDLASQVSNWIENNLQPNYAWPGNVRELEQCVRNIMVRNDYHPQECKPQAPINSLLEEIRSGSLSIDELTQHYCTLVYARTGSYQETGRRLGLDRRTVKSRIDEDLLSRYENG